MSQDNQSNRQPSYKELAFRHRCVIRVLAGLIHLWGSTLRWRLDEATRTLLRETPENGLIVLWHNQLFAAPAFFRCHARSRQLAALVSASRDGAWLACLVSRIGMHPVRGSSHRRGAQALRELKTKLSDGFDVFVTPDGSRGPVYVMKPGVAWLAKTMRSNVVLLAIRPRKSLRLKSWDRFHLPLPFSVVEVEIRKISQGDLAGRDVDLIRSDLESQLREMCGFAE